MYSPDNMTFQYFFFDTYVGYFLQALPIALMAGAVYGFLRFRNDRETSAGQKLFSCMFVCYITGLLCLVVGLDLLHILWYNLFYPMDSGISIPWFGGEFYFVPDFFDHINGEVIGNFLMFLPFGILHPLSRKNPAWAGTVAAGMAVILVIEMLQPIFGRAFDMNDILLNMLGVVVSASAFMGLKKAHKT